MMAVAARIALGLAILVGLSAAPAALVGFIYSDPQHWTENLKNYQSLAAGLTALFAASLATIGALLNIDAQRRNAQANIDEGRRLHALERHLTQQSVTGALAAEVTAICDRLQSQGWSRIIQRVLNEPRLKGPFTVAPPADEATPIFLANAEALGSLSHPLPRDVVFFYNYLDTTLKRFHIVQRNSEAAGIENESIRRALGVLRADFELVEENGRKVVEALELARQQPFVWPPTN